MTELLTAAQMRAIEQDAIESGDVTGLALMERAGQGVVEAIFEEWPELGGEGGVAPRPSDSPQSISEKVKHRAVVLCGPGNNGGDGFVVARLLKERGWEVEVFLYGNAGTLPPDAKINCERWRDMGAISDLSVPNALADMAWPDIIIDAVFGTGLARPVEGGLAQILQSIDGLRSDGAVKSVAIDLPSGLCSDSGRSLGVNTTADLTVSFHRFKLGHVLDRGAMQCGRAVVKGIGLDDRAFSVEPKKQVVLEARPAQRLHKHSVAHKFSHGHAFVLSGGAGKTGAARLAARGALRVGAGLVTLGVPHEAQTEVAAQITALMMREVGDAGALAKTLEDDRLNALCIGPGFGVSETQAALVGAVLKAGRATVLDADALTLMSRDAGLFAGLHDKCVLTPHAGEFKRLFPDIAEKLSAAPTKGPAYSKVDATREAAKRAGCVVLFKGADTVIAAPDGRCSINAAVYDRSAPWLATAGSGDVLAGFITGLLARGLAPMQAAETGAWLHVECARTFGPGLIAEDLPEQLPDVLRSLGA
ncbi:NAD(P)H-hydrate dehydratase [Shimia thalassica]|uniref:NAD(P)H-hydrate dehydratase n=1 Tax=Shimia thalassica TaxID=1715693 RepID=UPI001C099A63|nr:NAD(P)H-hydrate dehydratase [Shimia thalassica]MBU2941795.1 NAD(P)H-hydrate dehydratase [Shimia thalassica]MDO6503825.1 NAD(P)H-hydrate dehydratase [Shimia thalassica]